MADSVRPDSLDASDPHANQSSPHLQRRMGLTQATALNMINMIGGECDR